MATVPSTDSPLWAAVVRLASAQPMRHPALRAAVLAHWRHESAAGTSAAAQQLYNFANLPWRPEMAGLAQRAELATAGGLSAMCRFATIESFVDGYWRFLDRAPYTGWEEHTADAASFWRFVGPRWSGRRDYADRVLARLPEAEAQIADARRAASAPGGPAVVIDPGHGGTSALPGSSPNNATSASGVKEKKLTLDLALMIDAHLRRQAARRGVALRVLLTRDADINVAGADRAALAARSDAVAFLSLHFNGLNGRVRGTETFYAAPENGNLNTAADLAFARRVQQATLAALTAGGYSPVDRGVKPDTQTGVRRLAVLSDRALVRPGDPTPPVACLLEAEFIDHPLADRALVSGPGALALRGRLAEALAAVLLERVEAAQA
jgi:N-acetylmuramoyl-L-alanine amidase